MRASRRDLADGMDAEAGGDSAELDVHAPPTAPGAAGRNWGVRYEYVVCRAPFVAHRAVWVEASVRILT